MADTARWCVIGEVLPSDHDLLRGCEGVGRENAAHKEYLADIWLTCCDFLPTTPS